MQSLSPIYKTIKRIFKLILKEVGFPVIKESKVKSSLSSWPFYHSHQLICFAHKCVTLSILLHNSKVSLVIHLLSTPLVSEK